MGCSDSKVDNGKKRNSEIEESLKKDKISQGNEYKFLLLGAGDSGKSTILKQIKILFQSGFTEEEKKDYIKIVHSNILESMQALIEKKQILQLSFQNESNEQVSSSILSLTGDQILSQEIGSMLKSLWNDKTIQEIYTKRNEIQMCDSAKYFFEDIDRIFDPDYVPTEDDVIHSRTRSTGIIEQKFVLQGLNFNIVDVGGQRNERKKWIHCFHEISGVIFFISLSEFDQKLFEDSQENRLSESIFLFEEICNSRWFKKSSIFLFLNKIDLFNEKIEQNGLSEHFPDYTGGKDPKAARKFLRKKILDANNNPNREIHTFYTCATDTENISKVFNKVKDLILKQTMNNDI
ncbi:guanine nucleotide-binding protein g(o) subunit alpha [Anaeramoeba ignava]|uniref:Guanine nucleotide-binding protein g(O) subunit alpha n=1 Tax=Anaeramoeba ignava TaxID=1746090 RepID=A0A9Q0LLD4_ANAIG|nr:guanine nucleotide-binding protein g(o) subunit alpha [Anaeramoeba ignava]